MKFFHTLTIPLLVAVALCIGGTASAQVIIEYDEIQPGIYEFSTQYVPGGGGVVEYQWIFGDGNTAVGNPVTNTFSFPGLYIVYLYVYQNGAMVNQDAVSINVTSTSCDISPLYTWVSGAGGLVQFLDASTSVGSQVVSWHWDFGDGAVGSGLSTQHTYAQNGTYIVCLTLTDALGCTDTVCNIVNVTNAAGCPSNFIQVNAGGMGTSVTFQVTTPGNTAMPFSLDVSFDDGTSQSYWFTSGPYSISHSYPQSNQGYQPCFVVTDANGCVDSTCIWVTTGACPATLAFLSYSTGANNSTLFMLTSAGGTMPYTVNADFGDGSPLQQQVMTSAVAFNYTYPVAGLYDACFYVTDATGCTDTICSTINSACGMFATAYTQTQTPNGVELNAVATGGQMPYTFTWSPAASLSSSTGVSVLANPTTGTTYCVTAVDANGCSAMSCDWVDVPCTISGNFVYVMNGNQGQGFITNPVAGAQYIWIINNQTFIGPTVNFYLPNPGFYTACVQVTYLNCTDYVCDTIAYTIPNGNTLSGFVWNDANGNGIWDAGEAPLPQTLVTICLPDDTLSCLYAYTDPNGFYQFIVPSDTFEITAIYWGSYAQTFPISPQYYTVITTGNQTISGFNFGFQNQAVTINGCVFYDTNNNGTQDAGETGAAYQQVNINGVIVYTNANGCYSYTTTTGTYTVTYTVAANSGYTLSTPATYTVAATTIGATYSGNSFGLYADPTMQNLCVNVTPWTTVTPGFPAWYYIQYCNYGASPATGQVTFTWDPVLVLDYFSPAPATTTGSSAAWNFTNLAPGQCITIFADFDVPTTLALGTLVVTGATVTPIAGDINPANNIDTTHQTAVGSWDPNMKETMPVGVGANGAINPDHVTTLTYTVHFQNTGTAPAVNVIIVDTLSDNLDWTSFKMNAASHNYNLSFDPATGIVHWIFNNIMLPDSGADYQASMGFVEFEIDLNANLANGTAVENFADIYFDFNEAVRTNTVVNTIQEGLGVKTVSPGIRIRVMPNPARDYVMFYLGGFDAPYKVVVRNIMGQLVGELSSNGQKAVLHRQNLASGVYSFEIIANQTHLAAGTFVLE